MNVVEYLVKIRDNMSGPMQQIANNSDRAFGRITSRVRGTSNTIDQLNSKLKDLEKTRNVSIDTHQIERANREIQALELRRDRLQTRGRSGSGGSLLRGALLFGGLAAAGALGGQAIKAGIDRQLALTSFQVMAGDKPGAALHKNLLGFATDTIYGNEVFGEAKMMLSYGVALKNIMPAMRMLGDVALADKEHMKSLTLGFSEAASQGKLTGRELLIFADAGFNPLKALSEKTHRSMADLNRDMREGKIGFKDVAAAFEYATGPMGQYYQGMEKMAEKGAGKWIAFTGALEAFAGTVGMKLLPALGRLATFGSSLIAQPQILENVAWGIGTMTAAWMLYTAWTERAAVWSGVLAAAAYWPLALLGALTYAYRDLYSNNDKLADSTKKTAFSMADSFQYLQEKLNDTVYVFKTAVLGIQSGFTHLQDILTFGKTWDGIVGLNKYDKTQVSLRQQHEKHKSMLAKGFDDDGNKKGVSATAAWMKSQYHADGSTGSAPAGVEDTAKGIAGGGVRNLTINIAKQGVDNIVIHATTLTEGVDEIRRTFIEMFNQVVNSGNAAVSPN